MVFLNWLSWNLLRTNFIVIIIWSLTATHACRNVNSKHCYLNVISFWTAMSVRQEADVRNCEGSLLKVSRSCVPLKAKWIPTYCFLNCVRGQPLLTPSTLYRASSAYYYLPSICYRSFCEFTRDIHRSLLVHIQTHTYTILTEVC